MKAVDYYYSVMSSACLASSIITQLEVGDITNISGLSYS